MAEIINLDDYRTDCLNCLYHTEYGICTYPGGWKTDKHLTRCLSFRWGKRWSAIKKEGDKDADNGNHSNCDHT